MIDGNLVFHLRFADRRPFEELVSALAACFGGGFVQDQKAKADGQVRFSCRVFGVSVNVTPMETWEEGVVYRISGASSAIWKNDADEIDLSSYARRLLELAGCARIMTVDEFREESQRRGLR